MVEKNGGPAFPFTYWVGSQYGPMPNDQSDGMTLRDYFAAMALASDSCPHNSHEYAETAAWAYAVADAMLEAREVQP